MTEAVNNDGIDRTIISWRAWYTGGRTFDSLTTTWEELPDDGVLCVTLYYKTRPCRRNMSGRTLYWKEVTPEGEIYAYDDTNDAQISEEAWKKCRVKRGKWVTDEEMACAIHESGRLSDAPNESERVDRVRR